MIILVECSQTEQYEWSTAQFFLKIISIFSERTHERKNQTPFSGAFQGGPKPTIDMDLKEISKRLKEASEIQTDADLAQVMGFTRQEFYNYKRRGTIPFERILNYCHQNNISIEYVFFGSLSATEKEILNLQQELLIEKRLVTEIKNVMKEIVGKD